MLAVISPAKKLKFEQRDDGAGSSTPRFLKEANALAQVAKKLSRADLRQMMKISDRLADLNYQRFQAFTSRPTPAVTKQAVLAFAGDTYAGLDAETLSHEDLAFAQDHLRILSGLYGLLRPLDEIQPYRLEMGRRIRTGRGHTLYDYWGTQIARALDADAASHKHPAIINLASQEYFRAARPSELKTPVIDIIFKERKNGAEKVIGLFAKRARGTMARWIIQNRIEDPETLRDFAEDGYRFRAEESTEKALLFVRGDGL